MKRFLVTFFGLLVTILFIPVLLQAEAFTDPEIPNGQVLHYGFQVGENSSKYLQEVKEKEEVEESVTRISVEHNEKGQKIYRFDDSGVRKSGYRFEHLIRILADKDGLFPLSFETLDRNPEGRLIRGYQAVFDDPTMDYPPDTFPVISISQMLRGISFHEGNQVTFYLWITPTEIFRLYFDVIKEETIEVPAGEFHCFYGEMRPDIRTIMPVGNFLAKLLSPFIPKYRFWFAAEGSHPMVKFEGALGGAGATPHTIELTKIETPSSPGKAEEDVQEKNSPDTEDSRQEAAREPGSRAGL